MDMSIIWIHHYKMKQLTYNTYNYLFLLATPHDNQYKVWGIDTSMVISK